MNILDIFCWPKSKTFQHFSDFQYFTLSYRNSHKMGLTPSTDIFHHSIESWEPGEEDRTWAGGLRRLQESKKWLETMVIMFYAWQCIYICVYIIMLSKNKCWQIMQSQYISKAILCIEHWIWMFVPGCKNDNDHLYLNLSSHAMIATRHQGSSL